MVTTEEMRSGYYPDNMFIYNDVGFMDISFEEKLISVDKIKNDGYELGVNHRPIRQPHVNKIKHVFTGEPISIKVIFYSKDECYHIIQGQHVFTALKELMFTPESILCGIIKNKTTGVILDVCNKEDRNICFQYSYRITEGQERNCLSDKICMVTELSDKYKESGNTKGVIDYVFEHQCGSQRLSKGVIKNYLSYGNILKKNNLLIYAQMERWDEKMIKARISQYKLKKKTYKTIHIRMSDDVAQKFIDGGLSNNMLWNNDFVMKVLKAKENLN